MRVNIKTVASDTNSRLDYAYSLKRQIFGSLLRALLDFEWVKPHEDAFVLNGRLNRLIVLVREFLQALADKLHGKTDFVKLVNVDLC